ncbi:hypothetical protein [Nocardiopsis composta]|uniref:Uncharacterized protein n=1 Tax=Nocardiopsis composta TaxID=157465 RepID=A0A7W8QMQ0_9ACTN|nr:hypothetical protein [Nocardiopsis composta]MBB5433160.1 hypothetical protein [Nocardiopsis composta]
MSFPPLDAVEATTTVVQLVKGGEPDEDGASLAGLRSPYGPALLDTRRCACGCVPLLASFWERLERYRPYSDGTDLWVRTCDPDAVPPLPEGASVVAAWTVSCSVA